jgi:hypothetical protein
MILSGAPPPSPTAARDQKGDQKVAGALYFCSFSAISFVYGEGWALWQGFLTYSLKQKCTIGRRWKEPMEKEQGAAGDQFLPKMPTIYSGRFLLDRLKLVHGSVVDLKNSNDSAYACAVYGEGWALWQGFLTYSLKQKCTIGRRWKEPMAR